MKSSPTSFFQQSPNDSEYRKVVRQFVIYTETMVSQPGLSHHPAYCAYKTSLLSEIQYTIIKRMLQMKSINALIVSIQL